jgi:dTDP-L-rhamnose 4-epimerase
MARVLVTGGAGFIGSHLVDALVARGEKVRVLDSLDPQVHPRRPGYLSPKAEYLFESITDPKVWPKALKGVEVVYHLAAALGIGQSLYRISHFVRTNSLGTADLLQHLTDSKHPLQRLVVASSNTIYGEGAYQCPSCGTVYPPIRGEEQLHRKDWEPHCPNCGKVVSPKPTPESKPLSPSSIYAITKRDEEEMALTIGQAYRMPVTALRFFNVYGTRQTLSNPYTGVAAIFIARIRNGNPPIIYEDGEQTRDFVSVHDIVQGLLLAGERPAAVGQVMNLGTGYPTTIRRLAKTLLELQEKDLPIRPSGEFRPGDIRHCTADISKARQLLGYEPKVSFRQGIEELVRWSTGQKVEDKVDVAQKEMTARGLVRS